MCRGGITQALVIRCSQMGYFVFNGETFVTLLPQLGRFHFHVHFCLQNKRLNVLAVLFHITAA